MSDSAAMPGGRAPAEYANESDCWSACENDDSARSFACQSGFRCNTRGNPQDAGECMLTAAKQCADKSGTKAVCEKACEAQFARKPQGWENIREVKGVTRTKEYFGYAFLLLCAVVMVVGAFRISGNANQLLVNLVAIYGLANFAAFMRYAALEDRASYAQGSWKTVSGTVLDTGVEYGTPPSTRLFMQLGGGLLMPGGYMAVIHYRYQVGPTTYVGNRLHSFRHDYEEREQAESNVRRYKKGQTVTVYYDPDDPEESVLEPGIPKEF